MNKKCLKLFVNYSYISQFGRINSNGQFFSGFSIYFKIFLTVPFKFRKYLKKLLKSFVLIDFFTELRLINIYDFLKRS